MKDAICPTFCDSLFSVMKLLSTACFFLEGWLLYIVLIAVLLYAYDLTTRFSVILTQLDLEMHSLSIWYKICGWLFKPCLPLIKIFKVLYFSVGKTFFPRMLRNINFLMALFWRCLKSNKMLIYCRMNLLCCCFPRLCKSTGCMLALLMLSILLVYLDYFLIWFCSLLYVVRLR